MRYQAKQRVCANATKDITHSVHQYEIFNLLSAKDSNWKDEIFAGNFARVDMANESLGVIVEYFGDYWHCNPNTYAPDFFNVSLKMTAKEK